MAGICLAGDSYALGVWGKNEKGITSSMSRSMDISPGLAEYLENDGHIVDICGVAGGGLRDSITHFEEYLALSLNPDIIYMFVTDPFRNNPCKSQTKQGIIDQRDSSIKEYCIALNEFKMDIRLIGGVQFIRPHYITGLEYLSIACESVHETITPGFTHHDVVPSTTLDVLNPSSIDEETLSWLEACSDNLDKYYIPPWVPLGDSHPSSYGWKLLHEYLDIPKEGQGPPENGVRMVSKTIPGFSVNRHAQIMAYNMYKKREGHWADIPLTDDIYTTLLDLDAFIEKQPASWKGIADIINQRTDNFYREEP